MSDLKSFSYKTEVRRLDNLKLFYVEIPFNILTFFSNPEMKNIYNQRLMISINNCDLWHGGVVSLGNQTGYISIKGKILKDLGVHLDDEVDVYLTEDRSEYGMPFPDEVKEVLAQNPIYETFFYSLSMGKRRYVLYYVDQVKNVDKRIERAYFMLEKLLQNA
jgi:hypothetical protein